jgi:hypothetical protein
MLIPYYRAFLAQGNYDVDSDTLFLTRLTSTGVRVVLTHSGKCRSLFVRATLQLLAVVTVSVSGCP